MTSFLRSTGLAAALISIATLQGAAGQQTQQQPQQPQQQPAPPPDQTPQPPIFRTGINYVRVDVIVTENKSGNSVADLKPGDFDVLEDGKPQTIDTFKLIKLDGVGISFGTFRHNFHAKVVRECDDRPQDDGPRAAWSGAHK